MCTSAGYFHLLGGPTEMPWAFDRLYKADFTWALPYIDLQIDEIFNEGSQFRLDITILDVHGNVLNIKDVMPEPSIIYQPPEGSLLFSLVLVLLLLTIIQLSYLLIQIGLYVYR